MTKLYVIDEAAGILDEVQAWLLAKADNEGWVYTMVLRQLVNRLYRDRDYQAKRVKQGCHTAYDYALDRIVGVVLASLALILHLVAYAGTLIVLARLQQWSWFVSVMIAYGIAVLLYLIAGPTTPASDMVHAH